MRILILAVLFGSLALPAAAGPQAEGDAVRGAFIKQRPRARAQMHRTPRRKPPKPAPHHGLAATSGAGGPVVPVAAATPVGFGVSLYRVVDRTRAVKANPDAMFRDGDQLRFVLEPGIDGYLYIFVVTTTQSGAGTPVMVYPDARLDGGDNFVYAHTVTEVPSRRNVAFNIFRLAKGPSTETIYLVLSRDPLPGVPIGDELARLCESDPKACPWRPDSPLWNPLEHQSTAEVRISVRDDTGTQISQAVDDAVTTRDLVLGSTDDEPSVIAVNASAGPALLVRRVSIRHE